MNRKSLWCLLIPCLAVGALGCATVPASSPAVAAATPPAAVAPAAEPMSYGGGEEWVIRLEEGCRMYVREFGQGPPVVVLHGGWGAEHSYLLDAFKGLEDRYRLIFYDQRGSLRSDCPDSLISLEAHVADLERLRAELGLEQITIAAHSMGGYLAGAYLEKHPDRVRGLALLGPAFLKSPRTDQEKALAEENKKAMEEFMRRPEILAQGAAEGFLPKQEVTSHRQRTLRWRLEFAAINVYHTERWRQMRGGGVFYDGAAAAPVAKAMPSDQDFVDDFCAHPHPVTLIIGSHDYTDMGARQARHWFASCPNVEVILLDRAGHSAWIDQPEKLRRHLVAALEKIL